MKEVAAGRGRVVWLAGALLATLLAAKWVSGEDTGIEVAQAVEKKAPQNEKPASENEAAKEAEQLQLERLDRRKFSAQAGDIFRQQSWAPLPPPSPPSSLKPERASPPPLQFKYLGKIIDGEETQVFLALAERNYIVKPGDNINSQYRVDEVNDHAITFTYLPLNQTQTLATAQAGEIR